MQQGLGWFVIRRLLTAVVMTLCISFAAFFMLHAGSGHIARSLLGDQATVEQVAAKQAELGLDRPVLVQFYDWLKGAIRGDFGDSWFTGQPISAALSQRVPVTLSVCAVSLALTIILATGLGMLAATRGGWLDRAIQSSALIGFAIPSFIVAITLVYFVALKMNLLPATGYVQLSEDTGAWIRSVTLPAISLTLGGFAASAQQVRAAVASVMRKEYVRTLRSRGISGRQLMFKHVLRGAAPAGLTILSLQFIYLLGGSFVIESVFALPGIGYTAVTATSNGDQPLVMGVVVYAAVMVIVVNLCVDIANAWVNPKVKI